MSLQAGHKLAHYEILEPIGKGGMGEVYRARDGKLGRDVAIKVLPDEFAENEERLARFKREAKVLASLNHPNIASIYGLEQSESTHYLVLELVPGETLAERIARGPIPLDEALEIANRIAEALEEAHEQGIVHRDLKPANIKQTEDGKIKVLDFGLAKVFQEETPDVDSSMSPTLTRDATRVGVILGTAAYMSPEQAKGKKVDKRADIWAFGVVLYEMLTGKRAFAGEDVSDTLAYVLTKEPEWDSLPAKTPNALRQILKLCLTKDPNRRVRDIADVSLAMEGAFETEAATEAWTATSTKLALWQRPLPALLVAVLLLAAGLVIWSVTRPPTSSLRVSRASIVLPQAQRRTNVGRRGVAVSPTGTHIVYVANNQLYLRAMDEMDAKPVGGTEGSAPTIPFFSPNGQWIGFYSTRDAQLKKIALTGGAAVTLCDTGNPYGASWGADDTIVFGQGSGGIFQVSAAGGAPELLIPVDAADGERAHGPQLLPDGGTVLFTLAHNDWSEAQIVVQSLDSPERRVLIEGGTDARYLPTGHLIYALAGNLLAVPFDLDRLEVIGGPVPLVEDVRHAGGTGGANFDISRDGMLMYLPGGENATTRTLVWVYRDGREEPIAAEPRDYRKARISPNGTKAVLEVRDEEEDLWVWDFARETLTRLTFDPGQDGHAEWTPDGENVVFSSSRGGVWNLYRKAADGTGVVERLSESANHHFPTTFTPDGNRLVFREASPDFSSFDLAVLTLDGELTVEPLLDTDFDLNDAHLSPDGRWLAYQSDASGADEVYVRPFPNVDSGGRWQISTGGGFNPLWGPDGHELFFRTRDGYMMRVEITTEPEFRAGNPESIIESGSYFVWFNRSFDISPDGQRFLMMKEGATSSAEDPFAGLTRLIVVQNWFEELKARVPTDN